MNKQDVLTRLKVPFREIKRLFPLKSCIFDSTDRNDVEDTSDVDVIEVFNPKATFDLFMGLKFYLKDLLGIKVDLVTDKALRPQIRKEFEKELINVS